MTLTFWQIITMLGAGAFMTAMGAVITGVLVYKTKYAGQSMFHEEHKPEAEAFTVDDDFTDSLLETSPPEKQEDPEEVKAANEKFIKQFNMDRMIKEAEKYAEPNA